MHVQLLKAALEASGHTALLREIEDLRSALERLDRNFDLLLAGKPVRDVAETKAETRAALSRPLDIIPLGHVQTHARGRREVGR
jgi:hypothetical protein